jgi:hypothetical protein
MAADIGHAAELLNLCYAIGLPFGALGRPTGGAMLISAPVPSDARAVAFDASCIETIGASVYSAG